MPHELDRIKELAGLQQEAPAAGDQALAKDLANHFMNKANEFKKSGDTGPEYEEMMDIAKAFQQGQDQGMEEINDLANFEFSAHPFGGKFSNNEGEPEDEVLAILNKHGYSFTEKSHPERPNRGLVTLIKKDAKESAVQEQDNKPIMINGKQVDVQSIEIELGALHGRDAEKDAAAESYATKAFFMDGTELSAAELEILQDQHDELIYDMAYNRIMNRAYDNESAVQEAPGAEINKSTMPTELNRIKELAGLQQEAAVGLTAQQKQGLDAINAKYGKYIGYGNGGSLPVEAMERAIDPGSTLWADDKEENELKAYMKKMGYKDLSDMESKDEEYVDNVQLPISDAMADDLQKVLGDYNNDSGLAQAAKDYLGSLGETAVAEAPAVAELDDKQRTASTLKYSSDPRVAYFDKMLKRYGPKLMELIIDYSHVISNNDQIKKEKLKKYGNNFSQFMDRYPQMDGVEEDFIYMLRDTVDKGEEGLISFLYDRAEQAKTAGQFSKTSRLLDPDETHDEFDRKEREKEKQAQGESASQVDDTIQRARAQIETLEAALKEDYKKFQGMKPYKPKKK